MDNMVTPEELADNEEYTDIMEDIREELSNHGVVQKLVIPRPPAGTMAPQRAQQMMEDVGKIYVMYESLPMAGNAFQALNGRKFSNRTIVMTYMPENMFAQKCP